MERYFTLTTTATNAIDNQTIYGRSIYSPVDTVRLIEAHVKYPHTLVFSSTPVAASHTPLKKVLDELDNMDLHVKKTIYKEVFDRYDSIELEKANYYEEDGWLFVDLSGGDFKVLSKDRTAMLAENRRVYELISFLFEHNCEFEYAGSRAKIKIPIHNFSNRHLIRPHTGPAKFECGVYHVEKEEIIVEADTI